MVRQLSEHSAILVSVCSNSYSLKNPVKYTAVIHAPRHLAEISGRRLSNNHCLAAAAGALRVTSTRITPRCRPALSHLSVRTLTESLRPMANFVPTTVLFYSVRWFWCAGGRVQADSGRSARVWHGRTQQATFSKHRRTDAPAAQRIIGPRQLPGHRTIRQHVSL